MRLGFCSSFLISLVVVISLTSHQVDAIYNTTSWNYDTGRSFLTLSYAAYCPKSDIRSWSCTWCNNDTNASTFRSVGFASNVRTDGFAYIAVSASLRTILVSFRGTQADSLRNWITDLKLSKMSPYQNYTGVQVHTGFQHAYSVLKDSVLSTVKSQIIKNPSYGVVVTGHSLGGAVATLAAVDISRLTSQTSLWTFGSPRVGNKNFYTLVQNAFQVTYRVVNNRDMVPHLPPRNYDFWHVATEVWERGNAASDFKVCNNSGEDPTCSDSRVDISIVDHLNYFGLTEGC